MLIASFLDLTCNTLYFNLLAGIGNAQSLMTTRIGPKSTYSRLKYVSEAIKLAVNSVSRQSYLNDTFELKIDCVSDEGIKQRHKRQTSNMFQHEPLHVRWGLRESLK